MAKTYHEEIQKQNLDALKAVLAELPSFCSAFFTGIAQTTSERTRLAYAYDLRIFFNYLVENHDDFKSTNVLDITVSMLPLVRAGDMDRFLDYVTGYTAVDVMGDDTYRTNGEKGKARKLAAIRSMYKYFYTRELISANPSTLVDMPKIHDKAIVRLDSNEVADLLDEVENGENLTKHQKLFHEKEKLRDLAIVTMLVGTGMRVSECVGINIHDINLKEQAVKVTRKGGNEVVLYYGDEVTDAVTDYLVFRETHPPKIDGDDALFLSSQGKRISVRAVQNLVKKYSSVAVSLKKISPHKLRSTYGTNLYQETGDIYLVADVLGHADVNTTRKHYAEIENDRRRKAAKLINLRKD